MNTRNITMHAVYGKEIKNVFPCQYQENIAFIRSGALYEDWSLFVRGPCLIQGKNNPCSKQLEVRSV